jgi:hypothetical protein
MNHIGTYVTAGWMDWLGVYIMEERNELVALDMLLEMTSGNY